MPIVDALLPEFDSEMATTRRLLERTPLDDREWTPHTKSRTLYQLATHVTAVPMMATRTLTLSEFDPFEPRPASPAINNTAELLAAFDNNVREARALLVGKTDPELMAPWTFKPHGKELFTMPKAVVLRKMVLNHMIHHRGQLSVYLRLRDVPIPSIYGPSADEAVV